ncbi:MAG: alpha/beta hydrolase [Saprospiraceae bacterium]
MIKYGIITIAGIYILICLALFLIQEKLLFFPYELPQNHQYNFNDFFEEINLEAKDGTTLHGVHFKVEKPKGVILFLHGNGGTINDWGQGAGFYTNLGYDIFYLDYRGYGKSGGKIKSEPQLITDAQLVYDYLKQHFSESDIIVSGTSIGTGMAVQLAANNQPKLLFLNVPYASLQQVIKEKIPFVPNFIIKYKLKSEQFISKIDCPIYAFHGDKDDVIPHHHSEQLKKKYSKIQLTILKDFGHNNIPSSEEYIRQMTEILN